tara:strand:- start:1126 stop:1320 length:195 start_codon:yes stop_codon:yes gene_type:complete
MEKRAKLNHMKLCDKIGSWDVQRLGTAYSGGAEGTQVMMNEMKHDNIFDIIRQKAEREEATKKD